MKPSVSKLLDLLNKPALLKWANKIGLEGIHIDQYRTKAKSKGINYHKDVENFLKDGVLTDNEKFNEKMINFFKDKEIVDIEKSIEHEYFVGRYDVKLIWNNKLFICDFKSSSKVYLEQKLQLSAYKMAEPCDYTAVIHLPEFIIRPIDQNSDYEKVIYHLSMIYNLKERIDMSR